MRRLALLLALFPALGRADINYVVKPIPTSGRIQVTIDLEKPGPRETFRIPAWCPGFYFLENFERKIDRFRAFDEDGKPLPVSHGDVRAWRVDRGAAARVRVQYEVVANDGGLGFFGALCQSDRAFINGASTFMYVEGRKSEPTQVRLDLPAGWEVATGATTDKEGRLIAGDYDELIDHPIQLGRMIRRKFTVRDIPFEVVFVAPGATPACNVDEETQRLKQVVAPAIDLFRGASFKRYVFILHLAVGNFDGGLEHRASTVIATPDTSHLGIDDLAAHEYFHAWNVKQIRPVELGPFDYTQPVRTSSLWFSEGVTDYYAKITTYRSGLWDPQRLLLELGENISELQNSDNRRSITLADTSRRAWENGGFGVGDLSYYTKGLIAGFLFDAAIRQASQGTKSLDDAMRALYAAHHLPRPGFTEAELQAAISTTAGKDLSAMFRRIVNSTEEMPYEVLDGLGLMVAEPGKPISALAPVLQPDGRVRKAVGPIPAGAKLEDFDALEDGKYEVQFVADGETVRMKTALPTWEADVHTVVINPTAFGTDRLKRLLEWLSRPEGLANPNKGKSDQH